MMMLKKRKPMQQRKTKLLKVLDRFGYKRNNIICIYLEGSSLYCKNPHDIDYKVIVNHYNPKVKHHLDFDIDNQRSQATIYTLYDWNNIYKYKKDCLFITKGRDMRKRFMAMKVNLQNTTLSLIRTLQNS